MEIIKNKTENKLEISLVGRLDTTTAPKLEEEINAEIEGVSELILDFDKLEYISSAGLRVLLSAQKIMNRQGSMIVKNANDDIKEVFDITGFADILTIE
ncbi:MAG: STAS domain-containing protein [Clostridia bacterium]|nr:STAS domain-containing protein [Clostridia bacterium]